MPKTAIVILNWNGERHLAEFLPSVVSTAPPDVDIVVADNGSTDRSVELLHELFPRVKVIVLERNWGYAEGYNRALKVLTADYFILLNSDVKPLQGWCEKLIDRLEADDRLAAVAPKLLSYSDPKKFEYAGASGGFIDALGYPFCRGRILAAIEKDEGQYDDFRRVFWASGACMAVRSDVFAETGGFDDGFFAHMEEIDFCWRVQLLGYHVAVEPASVVHHLGGGTLPNNTARKLYLNFRNNLAMLYKNLPAGRRWWMIPLRMCLDGGSALVYLMQGRTDFCRAVWNAHRDFGRWRDVLDTQRKTMKTREFGLPETVYRGSILLRYFFGKKTFDKLF